MKLHFKKMKFFFLCTIVLFVSCIHDDYTSSSITITDEQKALIREFASENGYPSAMALDSFVRYVYDDWPNDADRIDFYLTFPRLQDTTGRTLVLSDVLTKMGKSLRVHYEPAPYGGAISSAKIDSIRIKTDSVVVMPALSLSYCNLTHLPPEIGKVRVNSLDISNNQIKDLPLEIMSIFNHLSANNGNINVSENPIVQSYWSNVPDTMKTWLRNHLPD